MQKKFVSKTTLSLLLVGALTTTAIATDYKSIITHRQGIYDVMAGHMKTLKSILFQGHSQIGDVNYHASAILEAAKHHGKAFPKGSDKGKTNALPAIWEKPEDFKAAGMALGKALKEFIAVSENPSKEKLPEMQSAFKKVGKACGSCHDNFRAEL